MTLGGDGVMYELRSRNVLQSSRRPDLKRRHICITHDDDDEKKKNSTPWWLTPDNGKPVEGWFVEEKFRCSNKWIIHPSRFPATWGPYILPDGSFDEQTRRNDMATFLYGLIPLLPPSERKAEAALLAQVQLTECAETSLAHFNKTQTLGMGFDLVKAVELNVIVCSGIWFHVNFVAKPEDPSWAHQNILFFSELTLAGPNKMEVKRCAPLKSKDSGGIPCIFCHSMGKEICHPAEGLQRGFTSADVMKPRICLRDVNSYGMFEFEKWYDNRYAYMQASRPPRCPEDESKGLKNAYHKQCTDLAKIALAHHNKQMGKHFKFVEAVSSASFRHITRQYPYPVIWSHANFKAKPKNTDSRDSSPKLFFAEMYKEGEVRKVTKCTILEPNNIGEQRCRYCSNTTLHPIDGYEGYVPPGCGIVLGRGIVLGETI